MVKFSLATQITYIAMKKITLRILLFLIISPMVILSCNDDQAIEEEIVKEELLEEEEKEEEKEEEEEEPEEEPDEEVEESCNSLEEAEPNSTIEINCEIDLQGKVINLPVNTILSFEEGGNIINGTLNFSSNSVISGELLNSSVIITGIRPQLQEDRFQFYPDRWGIVEGKVKDEVALKNKEIINNLIKVVKDMGATTFEIGKMDAYFDVRSFLDNSKYSIERSIWLPSNFTLKMTDETHIRVQPNEAHSYVLVGIYKGENINVIGGNLHGDRWEHDYSPVNDIKNRPKNSHEWGHVFLIAGGRNVLVDDVHISDASGDGFSVYGSLIRNEDGTPQPNEVVSQNVTLRNSTVTRSRRNGLSLLDGDGILIENCHITDTAQGENPNGVDYSSAGTWPKYGISFEAWRQRVNGRLLEYNKIQNVTLRGNTFTGNFAGDVVLFTCSKITIENNFFDSRIGNIAAFDIIIRDNHFKARIEEDGKPYNYAININSKIIEGEELNYDYSIYDNTIEGYGNAMVLSGKDFKVYNNNFLNNANALGIGNIDGGEFYKNKFNSNVDISFGYFTRGGTFKNVSIHDEKINVNYRPINLRKVKATINSPLTFTNCEMISLDNKDNFIEDSENISITDNVINTDFIVNGSQNVNIENNTQP